MIDFIDETTEKEGTPLNRKNLMGIQGFENKTITVNPDGSITETNNDTGHTTTTRIEANGNIVVTFQGEKTTIKKISISENVIRESVE